MTSVFCLLMIFMIAAFGRGAPAIQLPDPGKDHMFKVAVSHFPLTNTAVKDAYKPEVERSIMASLFIPVPVASCTNTCSNSYMLGQTARIANEQFIFNANDGVFEKMGYNMCCGNDQDIDGSKLDLVVLEPHTDTSRLLYLNMARFISANGVAVVILDHPGETSITEFTGTNAPRGGTVYNSGTVELSNLSPLTAWNTTITKAINTRISDINFALSQLSTLSLLQRQLPSLRFSTPLTTTSYSIIGHGFGGTTATTLGLTSRSVKFSINLSGSAPPASDSLTSTATPTYFFGRANYKRNDDINWPSTWTHLTGPATELDLNDSEIFDFSDLPVIVELAQSQGGNKDVQGRGLGGSGSTANHAMLCFVEAVVKKEGLGDAKAMRECVRMFPGMVPFGGGETIVAHKAVRSGAGRLRVW
ncbi:hypothetical protein T440DRAFT_260351 [Plenodomus tracheiphilus IPT5]|uniref:Uncharacterized protein n=1 Tax=Plenodomus tracheiphilus IPT5 TaxID=1408161 RepID=A0A6A7ARF1_9PLEO|nr:hypothetical protein T440DRAFT_260351 [Plenodomus tracheiphilus IPT5]